MSSRSGGHVTEEALERLWSGEGLPDLESLAPHLLRGCEECAELLRPWFFPEEIKLGAAGERTPASSRAPRRARSWARDRARQYRREREDVPELLARLEGMPAGRQALILRSALRFRTPAMVDGLITEANLQLSDDIHRAVALARLAVVVADALRNGHLPDAVARDFQARALVALARALRRSSDLREADRSLQKARSLLNQGTGDRQELASLLQEEGLLRSAQRRFDEAVAALNRAHGLYRALRDQHLASRALIRRADVLEKAGEYAEAVRDLAQAARGIDPVRRPRSILAIVHNLAVTLARAGLTVAARQVLSGTEPLYTAVGRPLDFLKVRWLIGSLLLEEGNVLEAAHVLADVRNRLAERDLPVEAATVSLELALAFARQGRTADVRRAVLSAIPVFEARHISRDLLAALSCLRRAAETEAVSTRLIQEALELVETWKSRRGASARTTSEGRTP